MAIFAYLVLFYVAPFLLIIVLPSILIPITVRFFINRKRERIPSLKLFISLLILGGFLANVIWVMFLQNSIYHSWDPKAFLSYTFFNYDRPSFGIGNSWIQEGWKAWHLTAIWFATTIFIYFLAGCSNLVAYRKSNKIRILRKIIVASLIVLLSMTIGLPKLLTRLPILHQSFTGVRNFTEKNIPCTKSAFKEPRILFWYNAENGEVVTDVDGQNIDLAFEHDLQIRSGNAVFSPDEAKVLTTFTWNNLWISCVNSQGVYKITLPDFSPTKYALPYSRPSWSPDSNQLVLNLYGDLATIDVASKKITVHKKRVAYRDNGVDMTSKGRNQSIPAYEVGSAYWSRNGLIYYTSFEENITVLHRYDPTNSTDEKLQTFDAVMRIVSGDPTGKYLVINTYIPREDRSFDAKTEKYALLDENGQLAGPPLDTPIKSNVVWSPSGKYFSYKDYLSPVRPTMIYAIDGSEKVDVSQLTSEALRQANHTPGPTPLAVEIIDFIDDDRVLVRSYFLEETVDRHYVLANSLINFHSKESKILQYYPRGQETGKELFPMKVLH